MDRKISLSYRVGGNGHWYNPLKGNLAKFTKINCAYYSTSSKDRVTDIRLALPVKQKKLYKIYETSAFKHWTEASTALTLEKKETIEVVSRNTWDVEPRGNFPGLPGSWCRKNMAIF